MKQSFQNTRYRAILLLTGLMLAMTAMAQTLTNDALDLSGMWRFQLDPMGFGKTPGSELYLDKLSETIMLPGSTDQGGKGIKNTARYVDRLSRKFEYQGAAWYQREVVIPEDWADREIYLKLERCHWETTVYVDDKEAGMKEHLSTPNTFVLTPLLTPGIHTLTICVNNTLKYPMDQWNHGTTEYTQTNWKGIAGDISLYAKEKAHIRQINVYPDVSSKAVEVSQVLAGIRQTLPMGNRVKLWDEFTPYLYEIEASWNVDGKTDTQTRTFGMRNVEQGKHHIRLNGRHIHLRGVLDCAVFPLTGYPSTNVDDWKRIFTTIKEYGMNHVRFHSWCPPEAAFIAADLVGFYLQPEGPSWPNHGPRLGNGQPIDKYLMDETIALTKEYGNYASYCMLACGNEPSGRWVAWVSKFVDYWKATDPRRVYTGASVGNSWQWQPHNEYHVKAGARGLSWAGAQPESESDYRARIDTVKQPYVSHETGQWCVFPNFNEIRKYTGVNKAKNFEIFRDILNDNQMGSQSHDFMMASGKLQALCYKHEIEKTLRTPDYAGFQLLALNDYSGQGTALVGVLDVFFEEKGYINAEQFRRFCSPTVPLARIPKFVYANNETFHADIEVSHFGAAPLESAKTVYTIKDKFGKVYAHGTVGTHHIPIGNLYSLGSVDMTLEGIDTPQKLNLEVRIEGCDAVNDWDFWVYPAQVELVQGTVYTTDTLDAKALAVLQDGGNVLITAAGKIQYGKEVKQYFTPVFWNTSWFKMRPPHTTGIFLNEYHPLFREFPTEYHSNLQWWELLNKAQVMQFTDFPATFQPTVQSIDTWFISRKIGMLFEAKVLNGKLMMTSMDITSQPEKRIVARQMHKAILNYMNSDAFRPADKIAPELIQALFTKVAGDVKSYTKDSPDELKPKIN